MFKKISQFRENRALKSVRRHFLKLTNIPEAVHPMSTAPLRLEIHDTAPDVVGLIDLCEDSQLAVEMLMRLRLSREIVDTAHNLGYGNSPSYGCLATTHAEIAGSNISISIKENLNSLVSRIHANINNASLLLQIHKDNMLAGIRNMTSYQLTREVFEI